MRNKQMTDETNIHEVECCLRYRSGWRDYRPSEDFAGNASISRPIRDSMPDGPPMVDIPETVRYIAEVLSYQYFES